MRNVITIFIISCCMFTAGSASAQPRWKGGAGKEKPPPQRLEKFRKMRLVEVLKLNEDDAVRFFAKQNAHEDKIREYMNSRNETVDAIEESVKDEGETKKIGSLADQLMDTDKKIFEERQRFQNEMRQFL